MVVIEIISHEEKFSPMSLRVSTPYRCDSKVKILPPRAGRFSKLDSLAFLVGVGHTVRIPFDTVLIH